VAGFKPFSQFAKAAYCKGTSNWTCGEACSALPGFIPTASGGDDGATPYWFVGYWPTTDSIVVAHAGTDPHKLQSLLVDADLLPNSLDPALFPGIDPAIRIHVGFLQAQANSAPAILAAVKDLQAKHKTSGLTVVGHSLGGAIASLDAAFLQIQVPSLKIKIMTYGQPRVGNQVFADYMDSHFQDYTRVTNLKDLVPTVPGKFLGFHHSHGEVHFGGQTWTACAGQDNTDARCSTGQVPTIIDGNINDHLGPYDGVQMGITSSGGC